MNLLIIATVVACIARTVTVEEITKEFREWCIRHSKTHPRLLARKACYLFTCEYCFSHWVAGAVLGTTGYRLPGWGFLVTLFVVVGVANVLMGLFTWLKLCIRLTRGLAAFSEAPRIYHYETKGGDI